MNDRPPKAIYPDPETGTVFKRLCDLEQRSYRHQFARLVREAVERRGLDWDELVGKQNTPRNVA